MSAVVNSFAHDGYLQAVLVLIAVDVLLGIAAALKTGTFKLSWLSAFAKDDILFKVFPWFVIYAAAYYAPSVAVLGIDLSAIEKIVFVAVTAALAGSMAASLKDLGLPVPEISKLPSLLKGEREPPPEP